MRLTKTEMVAIAHLVKTLVQLEILQKDQWGDIYNELTLMYNLGFWARRKIGKK